MKDVVPAAEEHLRASHQGSAEKFVRVVPPARRLSCLKSLRTVPAFFFFPEAPTIGKNPESYDDTNGAKINISVDRTVASDLSAKRTRFQARIVLVPVLLRKSAGAIRVLPATTDVSPTPYAHLFTRRR